VFDSKTRREGGDLCIKVVEWRYKREFEGEVNFVTLRLDSNSKKEKQNGARC
jgi:hypothetical protein